MKSFIRCTLFILLLCGVSCASKPPNLYRVVSKKEWQDSQKKSALVTPTNGKPYICLAMKDQIPYVISKFYSKEPEVIVVKLNMDMLNGRLVKEQNKSGEYYHLYDGNVPMDAIVGIEMRAQTSAAFSVVKKSQKVVN